MATITRHFIWTLLITLAIGNVMVVSAQDPAQQNGASEKSSGPALYTYKVAHDHRIGKGLGEAIRGFKKALIEEEPSSPTSHQVVGKEEERRKEDDRKMIK